MFKCNHCGCEFEAGGACASCGLRPPTGAGALAPAGAPGPPGQPASGALAFFPCTVCGAQGPTWPLTYHSNVGVIIMHFRKATPMVACRSCVHVEYWKRFALLITVGWTSYFSVIIGPILLVLNTVAYVSALTSKPTGTELPPGLFR